ncbi:hypothetical protein [Pseudomonas sp. PvP001]|uniref:hypothetical protein n=1 Tax=Pseudomonas sp. PvP001 TaxID=3158559 RepID=UPI0033939D3A
MERPSQSLKLVGSDFFAGSRLILPTPITKDEILEGICHCVLERWHQLAPDNQTALGLDTRTAESPDEQALQSVTWLLLEAASLAAQKARQACNKRLDAADY